ncbi:hypothetical protein CN918_31925 [Priestia megaterium]|nr:hypothetical protein CN918_31925 [Priestia megaterium]
MRKIKTLKLDSGFLLFFDSSNTRNWFTELHDIEFLLENNYIDEKLHRTLTRQRKRNVYYLQEVFAYLKRENLSYFEIDEPDSFAVAVNCKAREVFLYQESPTRFIIPLDTEEESNHVKKLGFVSVDGSHFCITDISYVKKEVFDYTNRDYDEYQNGVDEFFKTSYGYFNWLEDGLCRVDGYFKDDKLLKIAFQVLPEEDDGYYNEDYNFEG